MPGIVLVVLLAGAGSVCAVQAFLAARPGKLDEVRGAFYLGLSTVYVGLAVAVASLNVLRNDNPNEPWLKQGQLDTFYVGIGIFVLGALLLFGAMWLHYRRYKAAHPDDKVPALV